MVGFRREAKAATQEKELTISTARRVVSELKPKIEAVENDMRDLPQRKKRLTLSSGRKTSLKGERQYEAAERANAGS